METATVTEVKNALSAYLRKVRAGQTVIITDRDRPVARLVAIDSGHTDRIEELVRSGLLLPRLEPLSLEALDEPPPVARASVLEALLDERRDSR